MKRKALTRTKERTRVKCARNDANDSVEVRYVKHSHKVLHGGVIKLARVVWEKELTFLHFNVDECGDSWERILKTNQEKDNRAMVTNRPGVTSPKFSLDVNVDDQTFLDIGVTPEELQSFRFLVEKWVPVQQSLNVVLVF